MLKSLPSGSSGYELDKVTAYTTLDTINISKCLPLSPDLGKIMAKSDNPQLRAYVWQEWRKIAGRKIKPKYGRYVELKNKKSRLNGYNDTGDDWRSQYEVDDFEGKVLEMYKELEPLYKQLHAYIRRR